MGPTRRLSLAIAAVAATLTGCAGATSGAAVAPAPAVAAVVSPASSPPASVAPVATPSVGSVAAAASPAAPPSASVPLTDLSLSTPSANAPAVLQIAPVPPSAAPRAAPATAPAAAPAAVPAAAPAAVHQLTLGVYAGPDSKGVTGAAQFGALTGAQPGGVLDFGGTDQWNNIAAPTWLIAPHAAGSARFEYSMPMLPDGTRYTLSACAAGAYNTYWRTAATNLIAHSLSNTIVRPGWEFNGGWYHWSAKSDLAGYVGCFRNVVTTMRSVAGQHFAFDWNPSLGKNAFPAELAYPGDAYVDYVGVDIYDTSWTHYPATAAGTAAAQAAAWNDDLNGDHGLAFWSAFAKSHAKPMAITEWGVVQMTNGRGGGDDSAFVDHMFDFMTDPANNVAYEHYFNTGSAADDHTLTGATKFPNSAAEFRRRVLALTVH